MGVSEDLPHNRKLTQQNPHHRKHIPEQIQQSEDLHPHAQNRPTEDDNEQDAYKQTGGGAHLGGLQKIFGSFGGSEEEGDSQHQEEVTQPQQRLVEEEGHSQQRQGASSEQTEGAELAVGREGVHHGGASQGGRLLPTVVLVFRVSPPSPAPVFAPIVPVAVSTLLYSPVILFVVPLSVVPRKIAPVAIASSDTQQKNIFIGR